MKLVLRPDIPFARIDADLAQSGWTRVDFPGATRPILAGEPETALWRRGPRTISYRFNPVVFLRVIETEEGSGLQAFTLGAHDIRALLRSELDREILLGLFAAREIGVAHFLPEIAGLRNHPSDRVAATALNLVRASMPNLIEQGMEHLRDQQRRHPERSAIFEHLPGSEVRLETLRTMLADGATCKPATVGTLRSALRDSDWRVRALSMIAAARWRIQELWPDVRRAELPQTTREGTTAEERSILRAIRQTCMRMIAGEPVVGDSEARLRACILGEANPPSDPPSALIAKLTAPAGSNRHPA